MEYTVRDIPLLKKAHSRWPITNAHRADIVESMHKILADKEQTEKNKIAAADMLRKIDALNLAEEKMLMSKIDITDNLAELTDAQVEERLWQLSKALGVNVEGKTDVRLEADPRTNVAAASREATPQSPADQ